MQYFSMRWLKRVALLQMIVSIAFTGPAVLYAEPVPAAKINMPPLVSAITLESPIDFCGEPVPLERREVKERLEKELLLSLWSRPQVILWLKRSTRYLPHIEAALEKNKLPDDLKYIAFAESALRPHAGSRRGAVGFWQFIPDTGRKYGLVIDERIDQRRNLFDSTAAAIRYLKTLYEEYGSWTLSAAAYNMGEEGLTSEILEQITGDFYQLYLPVETQRYIFRILSVKLILTDPRKFGFNLNKDDYYPPLAYDRVEIDCAQEIPIRIIARAANTYFKNIKDLNPEIRGHYVGKGSHTMLVPRGSGAGFRERYKTLEKEFLASTTEKIYVVKEGDSLSLIAEKFGVTLYALLIWNRIDMNRPIHPGDHLVVHQDKGTNTD
jgi:membrane-bound lytic murein transglycosylase D